MTREVYEVSPADLAWILGEGEVCVESENGLPEGSEIIDAWWFDGIIYLLVETWQD